MRTINMNGDIGMDTSARVASAMLCVAALFSTQHANAYSFASGSIINNPIQVFDLDANDGISAQMQIVNVVLRTSTTAVNSPNANYFSVQFDQNRTTLAELTNVALIPPGFPITASAQVLASSPGSVRAEAYSNLDGRASSNISLIYDFVLSPNTMVTFSGTLAAKAESAGMQAGSNHQSAAADPGILIFNDIVTQAQVGNFRLPAGGPQAIPSPPSFEAIRNSNSLNYSYSVSNLTTTAVTGKYYSFLNVGVSNSSLISPIPEPSTWMSLLSGLCLLPLLARQRRRK